MGVHEDEHFPSSPIGRIAFLFAAASAEPCESEMGELGAEQRPVPGLMAEDVLSCVVSHSITAANAGRPSAASAAPSAPPSR